MPHLTTALDFDGPILEVEIMVSDPRAEVLLKSGGLVRPPVTVKGLIDTGASMSAIDWSVVGSLELIPTGTALIQTPSTRGRGKRPSRMTWGFC